MDIKLIIIIAFSYLYGFFEIFMAIKQNPKRKQNIIKSGDRGSIWILYLLMAFGCFSAFSIGATTIGRIDHWDAFFALGSIFIIIGLIIRLSSIFTLKQQFTFTVTIIENHELIETGLFKFIRHPSYLGGLLIFIGISTSLSNWLSIILMTLPLAFGYIYRIRVEERFMIDQLGQKYIDYQKRTKRLVPMIY